MMNKKCRLRRRTAGLLAGLLIFLHTGAAAAPAPERTVLRVAFPELTGISETDEYGNRKGLLVDYLDEISKYTGWEYEYIPVENDDVVQNFLDGQYDLMGGTFYAPGFEEYFAYPDYSTGRSRAVLLCRKGDDTLRGYDLNSLNGKTIGVYQRATEKIRHLQEFLSSNDLHCQLRYYTYADMQETGNLYPQLRAGEVDMLLGNDLEAGGEFRMVASFQAQPYYIVTAVGNTEILDGLNQALAYILESTPNFVEETYNAHFPDVKMMDIQLNEQELGYIAEKGAVTVAVPNGWHPIYCGDVPVDHHDGILSELLKEMQAFTGLQFTFVYADTYEESVQMVLDGEADILGAYLGRETQAFSEGLVLSRPYIGLSNLVLKHKSVNYPETGLRCGLLAGCLLPSDLEAGEIRSYDTVPEMVAAVNDKEVDYIYGVSAMLEQEMQRHRYQNVVPVSRAGSSTEVSFAIARPVAPELLTILNKAISNIPTEDKTDLLNRNLISVAYTNLSVRELIYANPLASIAVVGTVLLLVSLGGVFVIRSRMKSALMHSQLEAAEAKSRAKSDFLSRMSHEIRTPMNAIVGLTDLTCMEQGLSKEVAEKLAKIRGSSQYLLSLINDILDMSRIENGRMEIERQDFSLLGVLDQLQEMMGTQAEQKGLQFRVLRRIEHDHLIGDPLRLRQILTNLLSNAIKFTPVGGTITLRAEETGGDGKAAEYQFSVADTGIGISPEDQERVFTLFEQLADAPSRSVGTGLGLPISRSMAQLMGGDLRVKSQVDRGSEFYMTLRFPLGTGEMSAAPETSGQERSLEGVRVLLAEDNDLNAEIAQELLAMQGMKVRRAADGQAAVELFLASLPGEFQVILMDIRMPVMDGHAAARRIRASGRPDGGVPIIAMTANSFKEDEEAARAAGMNGFVPKPVDIRQLLTLLRELLP